LGSAIGRWPVGARWTATAVMTLAVAGGTWHFLDEHPRRPDPRTAEIVATLLAHPRNGQRMLAPQDDVPLLHYYFPDIRLKPYRNQSERQQIAGDGGIDVVLSETTPPRFDAP